VAVPEPLILVRPLGFALAVGGSLGAVQVGQLRALTEAGITADLVVGASVGALNGAAYAADPDGLEALAEVWGRLRRDDVFPTAGPRRGLLRRRPLYDDAGLRELIRSSLHVERFEDLALPFVAVATDARTRRPVLLDRGPLAPALRASAAIPGAFSPVTHDGRRLIDGGISAQIPVLPAVRLGAASVVALRTNAAADSWPHTVRSTPWTLALRVAGVTLARRRAARIGRGARAVPVLFLPGPRLDRVSAFDFGSTARLVDYGYTETARLLERREVRVETPR
jgi:NTE family protein